MIRVAAVDDDVSVLKNIGKLIKRTKAFEGFEYIVDTFTSGSDFLHSEKFYDLLLLDIEMPQMNGKRLITSHPQMKDPRASVRGLLILLYKFSAQIRSTAEVLPEYPDLSGMPYLAVQ